MKRLNARLNALVPVEEVDGLPSCAFVAKSFTGTKFANGNGKGRWQIGSLTLCEGDTGSLFCGVRLEFP